MSLFSGKCDLADTLSIFSDDDVENMDFSNCKFFIYGQDERLHKIDIQSYKDAVRYLPYLESAGGYSKNAICIHLSPIDYITTEEREHLKWRLDEIKRIYRSLKRKKLPITRENILERSYFDDDESISEIIGRVIKDGDKATIEGIHLPLSDYYRKRWYDEMLRVGYSKLEAKEWIYGWRRLHEDIAE